MKEFIHLTVAAICEKNGQFLMVEEFSKSLQKLVINQPAGHVELNEPLLDAVQREVLEETACEVLPKSLVGVYQTNLQGDVVQVVQKAAPTLSPKKTHYLRFCFVCDLVSETDKGIDPDIHAVHWMSPEAIFSHASPRSSMVQQCLKDHLSGQHYPLDIIHSIS